MYEEKGPILMCLSFFFNQRKKKKELNKKDQLFFFFRGFLFENEWNTVFELLVISFVQLKNLGTDWMARSESAIREGMYNACWGTDTEIVHHDMLAEGNGWVWRNELRKHGVMSFSAFFVCSSENMGTDWILRMMSIFDRSIYNSCWSTKTVLSSIPLGCYEERAWSFHRTFQVYISTRAYRLSFNPSDKIQC